MYTCSVWVVMVTSGWSSTQLGMYMYMYMYIYLFDSDINTSLVQYRLCVDLLIIICGLRHDMYMYMYMYMQ